MKKIVLIVFGVLIGTSLSAQTVTAADKGFWDDPFNHPLFSLYVISLLIFIVILLVLISAMVLLRVLNIMVKKAAEEKAARLGIPYIPEQSWFEKLWMDLNASVPVTEEKAIELDHNYDGIKELDNHLPPWWKWLFYATIVWGVVYLVVYHFSESLPLSIQEYENEVAVADEQARTLKASQPVAVIDENALAFTNDADIIAKGKIVFTNTNCASCHRTDGGGNMVGPNLTDAYWINGGEIKNIFTTIKNGKVEKGMPAWGKVMSQQDVRDVTFYVLSLQGTNPKDAKAPQGELFTPKQEAPKDSVKVQAMVK